MKLSEIIDLESLQQIQDCFSKATGFAAIAVDYQGKPLLQYSCFSSFCSMLRQDPYFNDCCCKSDAHGSLESVRRNSVYIYRCYAGLIDFAVPIIVEGEYVASMLCGQVRTEESDDTWTNLVAPDENILKGRPELAKEYEKIPIVSRQRIRDTANLLYMTLNYIVEQYLLNAKNLKLLQEQKERVELEKQYKDLEIKFYNSQINPHFLFNALNVAGRQAYIENAPKTQDIIFALADMYRCFLNYSGLLITVEQELVTLKNYMFIQKKRFGDQFQYAIDVSDEILNYALPAMSLQIFVENAVRHGLEPREDLGCISVSGKKKDNRLVFEISDTGNGFSQHSLSLLNDEEFVSKPLSGAIGIGIYNVRKRLQHFFPNDYSIAFHNRHPTGTTVTLSIPFKEYPSSP